MKAKSNSTMGFEIYLTLTEAEARALRALTVYGEDNFLKMFYMHLGKSSLEPYEDGLRLLFESVNKELPPHLKRIDNTRKAFQEENPNK